MNQGKGLDTVPEWITDTDLTLLRNESKKKIEQRWGMNHVWWLNTSREWIKRKNSTKVPEWIIIKDSTQK